MYMNRKFMLGTSTLFMYVCMYIITMSGNADDSLCHAWNKTRRRGRVDSSLYNPLLATDKLEPTVPERLLLSHDVQGVSCGD